MKTGIQVGLAVVAGYVLGRYRKGKWALALAAMGAGKKLPGPQGAVLEQGKKLLSSNPVLEHLTQEVRDQLIGAGRTALTSAASRRIESISDSLAARSDSMRGTTGGRPAEDEPGDEGSADDTGGEESGAGTARRRAPQSRAASGAAGTRKPRSTSTARTASSERASGRRDTAARPRKRAAASGQEARPRRRNAAEADQGATPTSRKRSRSSPAG